MLNHKKIEKSAKKTREIRKIKKKQEKKRENTQEQGIHYQNKITLFLIRTLKFLSRRA